LALNCFAYITVRISFPVPTGSGPGGDISEIMMFNAAISHLGIHRDTSTRKEIHMVQYAAITPPGEARLGVLLS
jgi:hypothetical protein